MYDICIFLKFKNRPFNYDGDQNIDCSFAGEIKINLKLNKNWNFRKL